MTKKILSLTLIVTCTLYFATIGHCEEGIIESITDNSSIPSEATNTDTNASSIPDQNDSAQSAQSPEEIDASTTMAAMATTMTATHEVPYVANSLVGVEPSTGSATLSVPIGAPQGRAGIQPNVALAYSSSLKNGILGTGWSLEMGAIQRSTKRGVPKYDNSDTFILTQSGSTQELVYDASAGFYRAESEGAFMKIKKEPDYWVITDKKGTKYYFGQTAPSQQYSDPEKVFKWCLDKVEDLHGNYMTVSYQKDNNQIYPQYIDYTGNSNLNDQPYARIEFQIEDRPDVVSSYMSAFLIKTAKRIKRIKVFADGNLQTRYEINYNQSAITDRSQLSSITQYGSDDTTSLPPTTFTYSEGSKGFSQASGWSIPSGAQFTEYSDGRYADLGVRVADVNSDGFPDLIKNYYDCANQLTRATYLNNTSDGWQNSSDWGIPSDLPGFLRRCPEIDRDRGIRFGDANSDGKIDVIRHWRRDPYWGGEFLNDAYINNGTNQFSHNASWDMPYDTSFTNQRGDPDYEFAEFMGTFLADVNNDGYTDVVRSKEGDFFAWPYHKTYLSNMSDGQTGWSEVSSWNPPDSIYTDFAYGASFVDLNGDGLPDIMYRKDSTTKIYINNGQNWILDESSPWKETFGYGDLADGTTQFGDINGDGLMDLIVGESTTLINTGNGWNNDSAWTVSGQINNLRTRLFDANADGMIDFLVFDDSSPELFINQGSVPDLLVGVDNGIGAITTIEYKPSSRYNNTFLPFILQTVESVNINNSLGQSYTTQYSYAYGLWNAENREFRGFRYVKKTDPEGSYENTWFLQSDLLKGRVESQAFYNSSGFRYTYNANTWGYEEIAPGINFAFLSGKDSYLYSVYDVNTGEWEAIRTQEQYFYDEPAQLGNMTKVIQLGLVDTLSGADVGTDNRSTETEYHNNTTGDNWLVGLPKRTITKDNNGTKVGQVSFYYDESVNIDDVPAVGLLTKREQWTGDNPGDVPVSTFYAYDNSYGNLITTTDAKGNTTTISYDSTYHQFPQATENALGHSITNEYYGVAGVPLDSGDGYRGLWGQLKSTTDPNDQEGRKTYDVFGRPIATVSPLDSIDYPTTAFEYEVNSSYIKIFSHQREKHGEPDTIDSVQFFDGLGRLIQTKSESATPAQFVASGQVEYNSRGMPEMKYLPFFSSNPIDIIDSIDSLRPHTTVEYDPAGRVTKTTNPDGTYSTADYENWTATIIDENGHKQMSYFDAYGRLIKKEEYAGADGRSPHYPTTPYTLYTATVYTYDSIGNLAQVEDAQGNITTIEYDKLGRKIAMNDPDMGAWQYGYDAAGNLTSQIDAKGQQIDFSYDNLHRLINKAAGAVLNVNYTYDNPIVNFSKGRLTKSQYSLNDDTDFSYDALGRETESFKKIDGYDYGVNRDYDAASRLKSLEYPTSRKLQYEYNSAGQIIKIYEGEESQRGSQSSSSQADENLSEPFSFNTIKQGIAEFVDMLLGVKEAYADEVGDGLTGEYYDNADLTNLAFTRVDPVVNFAWGWHPPHPLMGVNYYSVRWTGQVMPQYSQEYTFYTITNDGVRLWINGTLVIDKWITQRITEWSGTINLEAGQKYDIKMEFFKNRGPGVAKLKWASVSQAKQIIPTANLFSLPSEDNPPSAPTLQSAEPGDSQVTLTWSNVADATGYRVHYRPLVGAETTIDVGNVAQYAVTDLINGTPYYFSVNAYNDWGDGPISNELSAIPQGNPPPAPVLNDPIAGDSQIGLTWNSVSGATGYYLRYATTSGGYAGAPIDVGNVTNYTLTGLTNGTTYYSVVSAYNQWGESPYSNETSATPQITPPGAPTLSEPVSGDQAVDLDWSTVAGANGYKVKYGTSSGNYIDTIDAGSATKYTVNNLANGTTYYFVVSAYNNGGESPNSNEVSAMPQGGTGSILREVWMGIPGVYVSDLTSHPNYPDNPSFRNELTSFEAPTNWAEYYGTRIRGYVHPAITGTYVFYIASDDYSVLYLSTDVSPANKALIAGVPGWTSSRQWNKYPQQQSNEIFLTAGQRYYIEVLHKEHGGGDNVAVAWTRPNGALEVIPGENLSPFVIVGGVPPAPILNNAIPGDQVVDLGWGSVTDATGYKIKYGTSSGSYDTTLDVGNVTNYTLTGLTNGTTYYFVVSAYNDNGESGNSNELSATPQGPPPSAPTLSNPVAGDSVVDLSWNSVADATGYNVKYGTIAGSYDATIDVGNGTDYTVLGLTNGTTYYFVVSAYNDNGESGNSNELSATPQEAAPGAPTLISATAGDTQVELAWNSVFSATGYNVRFGTLSGVYGGPIDVGDVTAYTVSGLTNDNIYYFVITAYNDGGESPFSNELSATPEAPDPIVFIQNVEYNAAGQITKIEYGNSTTTINTYDPLTLRLTNILTTNEFSQTIQNLSYQYDSVGSIISITDNINTDSQSFEYDELNRLVSAQGNYGAKTYSYDTIGNLVEKDGITYSYAENGAGPHAVTSGSDGSVFQYDANGNMVQMTKDSVLTDYIYDSENRLVEVKKNLDTVAEFEYDGDGGRTKKISYDYSGSLAKADIQDLKNPKADIFDLADFVDYTFSAVDSLLGVGKAQAAAVEPTIKTTRFIGSLFETEGMDESEHIFLGGMRVATVRNGEVSFYHQNHLGSTNIVSNQNGEVDELIEYTPFGSFSRRERYGEGESVAWFYFTGQKFDDETGLYYYGARYYDPALGRFITADTIVPYASDSQSYNRYAYTRNNPVNLTDEDGHFFWGAIIGAIIGGAISAATGGDIGIGFATGAIGGAIFGFVGGLGLEGLGQIAGHAIGGAFSGSISSVVAGTDPGWGALIGGFSAGAGASLGAFFGSIPGNGLGAFAGNFMLRSTIGAVVGGTVSVAMGGDFGRGAQFGAISAGIAFTANCWLHSKDSQKVKEMTDEEIKSYLSKSSKRLSKGGQTTEMDKTVFREYHKRQTLSSLTVDSAKRLVNTMVNHFVSKLTSVNVGIIQKMFSAWNWSSAPQTGRTQSGLFQDRILSTYGEAERRLESYFFRRTYRQNH